MRPVKQKPASLMQLVASQVPIRGKSGGDDRPYARFAMVVAVTLSIATGALAVWFVTRFMNLRRELRARFLTAGILTILLAYPFSFGPVCWIETRQDGPRIIPTSKLYFPIIWLANRSSRVGDALRQYANLGADDDWSVSFQGDEISWSLPGPGSMMPYRTVISCSFSDESGFTCRVSDGSDDSDSDPSAAEAEIGPVEND
jgi:hypothetical protein